MTKKIEKIMVAGAGSIGCYFGARLAAHGADVTLLLRPWLRDELGNSTRFPADVPNHGGKRLS